MKKKILKLGLLSLALALTWMGCRNPTKTGDNVGVVNRGSEEPLEVLLPSTTVSRSVEGIHSNENPHFFEDVTVYLKYTGEPLFTYPWSSAEIASKKKLIPNGGIPSVVIVAVNGEAIANGQFDDADALATAYNTIVVESQNNPVITLANIDNNGNLAGSYGKSQTALMRGNTSATIPHPTLANTRQATVELSSAVARFELGTLKAANPELLTSISVDAVYVNNYHTTIGLGGSVVIPGSTWEENKPDDGHWAKVTGNTDLVTSYDETMCYAFQIFPDLVPHFVYEVSGTLAQGARLADGTTGSFSGKYITLTGFVEFESNPPEQHTVYKIGLTNGGIAVGVDNITVLPEVAVNALEVLITILPWNEVTLTPNIF